MNGAKRVRKVMGDWYICPHCGNKQDTIVEWQTCSVSYAYHLPSKNWEQKEIDGGDFESWACPECDGDLILPEKLLKRI